MKSKGTGIVIFPEDMERIAKRVKPQYQFAVLLALSKYAQTGELPTEEEIGEAGMIAFDFMQEKVDDAINTMKSRRNAAASRWNEENAKECKPMQSDANECKPMQTPKSESESESESVSESESEVVVTERARARKVAAPAPVESITGEDLSENIRNNELIDSMIKTYGVSESLPTRDALLEDLEKHGEQKLRETLKTAALSNTRGKISVAFYRAILNGSGGKKAAEKERSEYQHRTYTEQDFKGMEVDLDAL